MTRLEELTLDLADDALSGEGLRELQALVTESRSAREAHIQILRIEAALRSNRHSLNLTTPIMERLRRQVVESTAQRVMLEIKAQPRPDWARGRDFLGTRQGRASRDWAAPPILHLARQALRPGVLALAACLVAIAFVGVWWFGPPMGEPVLVEIQGKELSLTRAGHRVGAVVGTRLQSGDILRTSERVAAVITYTPEKTRLKLHPGTELTLSTMSLPKRFVLHTGRLDASVARQRPFRPMVFLTPQAQARVRGTKLSLTASAAATRLEVTEGEVELVRARDDATLKVTAGHYAVVATNYALAVQPLPGKVLREFWLDLPGDTLQELRYHARYPNAPTGHDSPSNFESSTNWGSAFGTRIRGYLLPPVTGEYEFRIAGNGQIALWLSPDEDPADKIKIGQIVFTRNRPGDPGLERTRAQTESGPIRLEAGRRYYIEAAHKYGSGQDRLSVTWKRPDAAEEPIPAEFLAPFIPQKGAKR